MTKQQIIAMGGGGFSMEATPVLDRYVLQQTGKPFPKVCFVATASGDADLYALNFYRAFSKMDCLPSELSLFRPPTADLESYVLEKDVIYVGGGNTRSMLALWREWGLDRILRKALEAGVVLAGISAGGNCWFEQCTTDSVPGALRMLPCLGFLPGSFSPHYDGEGERRPTLHKLLRQGGILPGYAADNSAALHFVDGQPFRAVCSVPGAKVYRVSLARDEVAEEPLDMLDLSQAAPAA
jgi:dipeptidase E